MSSQSERNYNVIQAKKAIDEVYEEAYRIGWADAEEYGMEIGEKNARLIQEENAYFDKEARIELLKEVAYELKELLERGK